MNAAGSSTSALASASGLSRTMAMSISPPSLWIMVGRPACTSARIGTALFSHGAGSEPPPSKVPFKGGLKGPFPGGARR